MLGERSLFSLASRASANTSTILVEKTSFASNTSGSLAVKRGHDWCLSQEDDETIFAPIHRRTPRLQLFPTGSTEWFPLHDVIDRAGKLHEEWSSAADGLRASSACGHQRNPIRLQKR